MIKLVIQPMNNGHGLVTKFGEHQVISQGKLEGKLMEFWQSDTNVRLCAMLLSQSIMDYDTIHGIQWQHSRAQSLGSKFKLEKPMSQAPGSVCNSFWPLRSAPIWSSLSRISSIRSSKQGFSRGNPAMARASNFVAPLLLRSQMLPGDLTSVLLNWCP